ncbi:porin [Paraburkholderia ginsengiterrae]|uniref:Porin n=1 Tax=Paraburkholderia ginsengiterrae TaxID=1462993 RepID=A0A1A9N3V4_9BURK|nr:porin [Paraburkholderia ginsengiterrae]OAJ56911.1 porin [Paraburkholderia ginsengiterrae]OAJ56967.1 porin [Paraburkholderia ginsengiterrae]
MKKQICSIALPLLGVAAGAQAQSSVTLYGSLDAGVGYVSNLHGGRTFIAEQGTFQADRWGLTGTEDLGGGLKTVFKLESGFSTISGAMSSPGTLFNRQAYVGLSDDRFGTFTLGRQTDFHFEMLGPLSTAQSLGDFSAFHPGNVDGLGNTVPVEWSNALKFRSQNFAGVTFGAMYGFTNTTSSTAGRSISFGATYANGPVKLAAAYSEYHDRTLNLASGLGLTSFEGVNLTGGTPFVADSVRNAGVGGSYQLGRFLLHALVTQVRIERHGQTENYRTADGGVNFQLAPDYQIDAGAWTTTLAGKRWTQLTVANVYSLSKRTQLYADLMVEQASSGAIANTIGIGASSSNRQTVVLAGIHHLF